MLRGHSKESAPSRTPRNHSVAKASIPNGVASGGRKLGGAKTRHVEEKLPATRNETKSNGVVNGNPSNGFRNRGPTRESNKRNDAADSSRNYVKTPKSELSDSKTARENDKNVAKWVKLVLAHILLVLVPITWKKCIYYDERFFSGETTDVSLEEN